MNVSITKYCFYCEKKFKKEYKITKAIYAQVKQYIKDGEYYPTIWHMCDNCYKSKS